MNYVCLNTAVLIADQMLNVSRHISLIRGVKIMKLRTCEEGRAGFDSAITPGLRSVK